MCDINKDRNLIRGENLGNSASHLTKQEKQPETQHEMSDCYLR
jgi:hypothetical protein